MREMSSRQKRHWARVHRRWEAEVHRDMDVEPDTVHAQSMALPAHHPCHYEMVEPPPSSVLSTRVGGGKPAACTIQ